MADVRTLRLVEIPMPRHYDIKIMATEINNGNRYWKYMIVFTTIFYTVKQSLAFLRTVSLAFG
jgi:hypothetical protein